MSKVGNEAYERMLPGGSFAPPHPHEPQHFETKEFAGLQPYWPLLIPYVGCICCPCIVTANHRLVLEEDEAVLYKSNICSSSVERRPYAQLGDVQHMKCLGCLRGVATNMNEEQKGGHIPISPGWGCDDRRVKEIVDELQARKVGRGNIAQLRQQELHIAYTKDVNTKLDLIMKHLGLAAPPSNVDALLTSSTGAPTASPMQR